MDERDRRDYLRSVRETARPTAGQIEAFAEHVSRSHSWYKRLPKQGQGSPFFFLLRPHCHEVWVDVGPGRSGWRSVVLEESSDPFAQYVIEYLPGDTPARVDRIPGYGVGHMTSAGSFERYGLLSYWNHGSPDQHWRSAVRQARQELRWQDDLGAERPFPPQVLDRGLVYLRASVYLRLPHPSDAPVNGVPAVQDRATQIREMVTAMHSVVDWVYSA